MSQTITNAEALAKMVRQTIREQVDTRCRALDRGLSQLRLGLDRERGRQQTQIQRWLHQLKYAHLWDAARVELMIERMQHHSPPTDKQKQANDS